MIKIPKGNVFYKDWFKLICTTDFKFFKYKINISFLRKATGWEINKYSALEQTLKSPMAMQAYSDEDYNVMFDKQYKNNG